MAGQLTEGDAPVLEENHDNIIVIDHVPKVPGDKMQKLYNVIKQVCCSRIDGIVRDIVLPQDAEGVTLGFAFVEYYTAEHAEKYCRDLNGYKLDRSHTFTANMFCDLGQYLNTPDEFAPPDSDFKEQENMQWHLQNKECEDQYVVRHGYWTSVLLNKKEHSDVIKEREAWTDNYVSWSPKGTYMATFHQRGIALWGGEGWEKLCRFEHVGVKLIDFSPCERYLVTWSDEVVDKEDPQSMIIWDVRTWEKKRSFPFTQQAGWPVFKWAPDDSMFGHITTDDSTDERRITLYSTKDFKLLDKKHIKVPGVQEFAFSPSDNYISFWVPEYEQRPARVVLMELPSRKELAVKNLYSVTTCKMFWQAQGDYLAVKVERGPKAKVTTFDLFHVRRKLVPVDQIELKDTIIHFAWEPTGSKFAILHGENPRISASFYTVSPGSAVPVVLNKTMDKISANGIYWSPRGRFLVLGGLNTPKGNMGGILEFVDTKDCVTMNSEPREHFGATDIEWDPTGRFVASSVSYLREQVDNGYIIWNFQGRKLQTHNLDKFYLLRWRPRPKTLLTKEKIKKVQADLKSYQSVFEPMDKLKQSKASADVIEKRQRLLKAWEKYRRDCAPIIAELDEQKATLRPARDVQFEEHEETVEYFVKEDVKIMDKLDK